MTDGELIHDDERLAALLASRIEGEERSQLLAYLSTADEDFEVFANSASILREMEVEDARAWLKTRRALSIQQPWAWLIVHGHKPVENRDWSTSRRGSIGIHAGKKFDRDGYTWVREHFPDIPLPAPADFERGGIVGRAVLVDCVEDHPSPWFVGDYGFVLEQAEPLPFIPCRGMLGFFRPAF